MLSHLFHTSSSRRKKRKFHNCCFERGLSNEEFRFGIVNKWRLSIIRNRENKA